MSPSYICDGMLTSQRGRFLSPPPTFPPNSSPLPPEAFCMPGWGAQKLRQTCMKAVCTNPIEVSSFLHHPTRPPPICVQVANRAEFLGSGLLQHECKVGTEQFIGVFAQNRPEVSISLSLTAFRGINRLGNQKSCFHS